MFRSLASISWLAVAIAAPLERRAALPPTEDPFYQPTSGYQSAAPGTILKHRQISAVSGSTYTYQLLFRSTDSQGNPNAVVTTILVPDGADANKFTSIQQPYDSAYVNDSPSYTLQTGGNSSTDPSITASLAQGWYVNVPDYEGFTAAFTNGIQSGQATLDSLKAALASDSITGLKSSAIYTIQGYSGGALASEWALELQSKYAKDLKIAGAALGGLTPNVSEVLNTINKGPFVGLAPAGTLGLAKQVPTFSSYLQAGLKPSKAAAFNAAATQSLGQNVLDYAFQDIASYFTAGEAALVSPESISVIDKYGVMGLHGVPQVPVYAYKGVEDEISVVADTDALIAKYCAAGATIEYVRNAAADHVLEELTGFPAAFTYLQQRMNGVPVPKGCTTTTIVQLGLTGTEGLPEEVVQLLEQDLLQDTKDPSSLTMLF